jgi:polysaccharide biosynthesis transport protein
MRLIEPTALIPTRREVAVRLFRQRKFFLICFLLVIAGFVLTGQFTSTYKAEMKILVRKERVDPVVTTAQNSTPELQSLNVREEDLNSEAELLRGDDLLREVVIQAGLVPRGSNDPIAIAKALRKLRRKLDVSPVAKTDLISVSYESSSPEQSKQVLTTLESLYLAKQRNVRVNDYQVNFFEQQVGVQRNALAAAEAKLLDFTQTNGVVSASLQRDLTVTHMEDLNQEQLQTSAEMANLQGRVKTLTVQLSAEPERILTESKAADNPQLLQQLKASLLGLQLKRAELLNKYDEHYRLVEDVDREIATAQRMIDDQANALVKENSSNVNPIHQALETELGQATAQLTGLRDKQAQLSRSAADLEHSAEHLVAKDSQQQVLLLDAKTAQNQYQLYVDKLAEARMTHSLDKNGILNVVVAQEPVTPVLPQNSMLSLMAAALFTGLLLSFGGAFLLDAFDPTVRNAKELGEVLNAPVLAEFGRETYIERRLP